MVIDPQDEGLFKRHQFNNVSRLLFNDGGMGEIRGIIKLERFRQIIPRYTVDFDFCRIIVFAVFVTDRLSLKCERAITAESSLQS